MASKNVRRSSKYKRKGHLGHLLKKMVDSGHTPGPWSFDELDPESMWILGPAQKGFPIYIAEIVTRDSEGLVAPKNERVYNARLMAKSPDLFEIAVFFRDYLYVSGAEKTNPELVNKVRDTIAAIQGLIPM